MNSWLLSKIDIYRFQIILAILIFTLLISLLVFFVLEDNSKIGLIIGGISASLFVATFQFLLSLNEYKYFREIKKLDIKKIMVSRDDEQFYSDLIDGATTSIRVMGVTALRLMQDFASDESPRPEKKVLLKVLSSGVTVQILLPLREYLISEHDKRKHDESQILFKKLGDKFNQFKVRYFNHIATHSIFQVDEKCILGPVFSNYASKDTPCIYMGINNEFAKKYIKYFEEEWGNSDERSYNKSES